MNIAKFRISLFAMTALFGCASAPPSPEATFTQLEQRLLETQPLAMQFTISSEGEFKASLNGTLRLSSDANAELQAQGSFGGTPVVLNLRSDGQTMEGGNGQQTFSSATPPALRDALIIGLTRMGLLHNLAQLTSGAPPDHAAGGVREWVQVQDLQFKSDGVLGFSIHVGGSKAADATLRIDERTGLPLHREQVVQFPGGSMSVVEHYEYLP